jgi:hypothetical protein
VRAALFRRAAPWLPLVLLAVLLLPPVRAALEGSMNRHMLLQFPLVAIAGALLAARLPAAWRRAADRWNAYGIAGLLLVALVSALLMIPRVLDLALVDARVEVAKWLALLVAGAALRLSWPRAGLLVQGFFLGNVLPMMGVVGQLFQDSPLRLCNAYLLDDQVRLGQALVAVAVVVGVGWGTLALRKLMRAEAEPAPHPG